MPVSRSKKQTRLARKRMRSEARAHRIFDACEAARYNWLVNFHLPISFLP